MKPTEDKKYVAYCQKVLDKARDEYETASKNCSRLLKGVIGLGSITGIFAVLFLLALIVNHPGVKIIAVVSIVSFMSFAYSWYYFAESRSDKESYEGYTTCAEKIDVYAKPYENWLRKQENERWRAKKIEENEQMCAALKAHPIS